MRGDVEGVLFNALPPDVEIRLATEPVDIRQDADGVDVVLRHNINGTESSERFDLVVGADGVRSTVRRSPSVPTAPSVQQCCFASHPGFRRRTSFSCSNNLIRCRASRNSAESPALSPGLAPSSAHRVDASWNKWLRSVSGFSPSPSPCWSCAASGGGPRGRSAGGRQRGGEQSGGPDGQDRRCLLQSTTIRRAEAATPPWYACPCVASRHGRMPD